ncbi:MAG: putative DNA binding domain-containing protein [Leptospiraceae bacterium]|nr:putative DNA binding domain-containing protein [Leptospiraceae bacterium]MCK6380626.1 putative DNA binding domain-containing protein [Leptospiraceae bacterium]
MYNQEIAETILKGEDSFNQFKEVILDSKKLAEEMVAFSNAEGGNIFIGVADNGEVKGLSDSQIHSFNQLISNTANENVKPPIYPITQVVEFESKRIIIITIRKGINKPYQTGTGLFYTKSGSDKKKISQEELRRLFAESKNLYADEEILLKTDISDLNLQLFYQFLEKKDSQVFTELKSGRLTIETILKNLDLIDDGHLTLAGNLLFGLQPQKFSKSFYIDCVYFDGNDVSVNRFITKERIEGSFSDLFKQSIHFLKSTLKRFQDSENFNTIGRLEIPEETLSELIINAMVHRDYYINSSVKIFLFLDRLEIRSPGKLPNSLTIEKMKSGISIHRNPILNSLSQYILPYSGLGSGIKRALSYFPHIEFINDVSKEEFTCILKRK